MHASVIDVEADLAPHVGDRNAAIVAFENQVAVLRNEDFITDAPPGVVGGIRPHGAHLSAGTVDQDPARHGSRGGFAIRGSLDTRAHQHFTAQPAFHGSAAVLSLVDSQAAHAGDRLLAHFAMTHAVVIGTAILASQ